MRRELKTDLVGHGALLTKMVGVFDRNDFPGRCVISMHFGLARWPQKRSRRTRRTPEEPSAELIICCFFI